MGVIGAVIGSVFFQVVLKMNKNPPFYLAFPLINPFYLVCPYCDKPVNVKSVFSLFVLLYTKRASEHYCHKTSIHHAFAVLVFSALFILSSINYTDYSQVTVFLMLSVWFCLLISYDLTYFLLPDYLTFSLFLLGLLVCHYGLTPLGVWSALGNSFVVFFALWVMNTLFYWYRNEYGLGLGDIKLMMALATWFSLIEILHILILASSTALTWIIIIWFVKRKTLLKIPFGPFILFGAWIILLYN